MIIKTLKEFFICSQKRKTASYLTPVIEAPRYLSVMNEEPEIESITQKVSSSSSQPGFLEPATKFSFPQKITSDFNNVLMSYSKPQADRPQLYPEKKKVDWLNLPVELWISIINYLAPKEISKLMQVNNFFTKNLFLEKFNMELKYKNILIQRFNPSEFKRKSLEIIKFENQFDYYWRLLQESDQIIQDYLGSSLMQINAEKAHTFLKVKLAQTDVCMLLFFNEQFPVDEMSFLSEHILFPQSYKDNAIDWFYLMFLLNNLYSKHYAVIEKSLPLLVKGIRKHLTILFDKGNTWTAAYLMCLNIFQFDPVDKSKNEADYSHFISLAILTLTYWQSFVNEPQHATLPIIKLLRYLFLRFVDPNLTDVTFPFPLGHRSDSAETHLLYSVNQLYFSSFHMPADPSPEEIEKILLHYKLALNSKEKENLLLDLRGYSL